VGPCVVAQLIDDVHFLPSVLLALVQKQDGRPLKTLLSAEQNDALTITVCPWCAQASHNAAQARLDTFGDPQQLTQEVTTLHDQVHELQSELRWGVLLLNAVPAHRTDIWSIHTRSYRNKDLSERTAQLEASLDKAAALFDRLENRDEEFKHLQLELQALQAAREQELWAEEQVPVPHNPTPVPGSITCPPPSPGLSVCQAKKEAKVRIEMNPTPLDVRRLRRGVRATLSTTELRIVKQHAEAAPLERGAFEVRSACHTTVVSTMSALV